MASINKIKDEAKNEKHTLIKMILVYQRGNKYTKENLDGKTLRRLREIYDEEVNGIKKSLLIRGAANAAFFFFKVVCLATDVLKTLSIFLF